MELKTNILAAYVAAGLALELPDLMAALRLRPADSFEVAFNRACGTVAAAVDAAGPLAGGRLGAAASQQLVAAEGELRMALKQGAWVVPRKQGLKVQPARGRYSHALLQRSSHLHSGAHTMTACTIF